MTLPAPSSSANAVPADEFYVFDRPAHPIPPRIPASALSADTGANVLQQILSTSPTALAADPLVALEGAKSGLKVVFESNRTSLSIRVLGFKLMTNCAAEAGVQFYTNNLTQPTKNARKRIHGGPGVFGEAGYAPGSAAFLEFHAPLAAFLDANAATRGAGGDDTLLVGTKEVYNNFVRADVWVRPSVGGTE